MPVPWAGHKQNKGRTRTLANGHVRNDTFNRIFPLVAILAVEVCSKLEVLAWIAPGQRLHGPTRAFDAPFFGAARANTFIFAGSPPMRLETGQIGFPDGRMERSIRARAKM
jgi:hypothetical protein